jgi:hypothetical protein
MVRPTVTSVTPDARRTALPLAERDSYLRIMTTSHETSHQFGTVAGGAQIADPSSPSSVRRSRSIWLRAALSAAAALAAALIAWVLAVPVGGLELVASTGGVQPQPVGPAQIVFAVLLGSAGAAVVSALIGRFARHARGVWLGISITVGVLSLAGPPLSAAGASMLVLMLLHVIVGGILIIGLLPPRVRSERA